MIRSSSILTILIVIINGLPALSQRLNLRVLPGLYNTKNESHTNITHYEELKLNKDSTFSYFVRYSEFAFSKQQGKWAVLNDTLLLNENQAVFQERIHVHERFDPALKPGVRNVVVRGMDGFPCNYKLKAYTGDTVVEMRNQYIGSSFRSILLSNLVLSDSNWEYPTYQVENNKSNVFEVVLNPKAPFYREKWLILPNNMLKSRQYNGKYNDYNLTLELPARE